MLGKIRYRLLAAAFVWFFAVSATASELHAEITENFGTTPVLNNGEKWRVMFYEGGPHSN